MYVRVFINPYQTIADFFKSTTTGFSIWKFSTLPILFFILKIYSVLWNKPKPVENRDQIQIGLSWPLGYIYHKRWNRLKQNLLHVEN